eukprot:3348440-Amphidinium_carterae.1
MHHWSGFLPPDLGICGMRTCEAKKPSKDCATSSSPRKRLQSACTRFLEPFPSPTDRKVGSPMAGKSGQRRKNKTPRPWAEGSCAPLCSYQQAIRRGLSSAQQHT